MSGNGKSRRFFFPTECERQKALTSILEQQGFETQMDQYEILGQIGKGSANPVWMSKHRLTGLIVAIKCINAKKYR